MTYSCSVSVTRADATISNVIVHLYRFYYKMDTPPTSQVTKELLYYFRIVDSLSLDMAWHLGTVNAPRWLGEGGTGGDPNNRGGEEGNLSFAKNADEGSAKHDPTKRLGRAMVGRLGFVCYSESDVEISESSLSLLQLLLPLFRR